MQLFSHMGSLVRISLLPPALFPPTPSLLLSCQLRTSLSGIKQLDGKDLHSRAFIWISGTALSLYMQLFYSDTITLVATIKFCSEIRLSFKTAAPGS